MKEKQTLDAIARGGLVEQFNQEFDRVVENIYDPNTKAKFKRKITITMTLMPSDDRDLVETEILTKSTLAPVAPISTRFMVDKDHTENKVYAVEYYKDQMRGQMSIDELDNDTDTKNGTIIDFRKDAK